MRRRQSPLLLGALLGALRGAAACSGSDAGTSTSASVARDAGNAVGSSALDGSGGAGSGGAPTTPAACIPPLGKCDDASRACCSGSICSVVDGVSRCVQTCSTRFDCGSLCCLPDAASGKSLCAATDACPALACSDVGGSCSQPGPSCCEGLACVSSTSPDYAGCRHPCASDGDCDTGCCVAYANSQKGFCGPATACACAPADAPCGGVSHCCSGLACTTFDATGKTACKPACVNDASCATGCCRPIEGTAESACLPVAWCGR